MISILLFFNIHIQGWTPLHTASSMGHAKIVRLLLLLGADMDIVDIQVFCLCIDYLFSKYDFLTSMDEIKSMKKHKNIIWTTFISILTVCIYSLCAYKI